MTREQQAEFFNAFTGRMATIMLSKGDDYAGQDRLSNFKVTGDQALPGQSNTAEKSALLQISNKVTRLGQLLSGKTPKNESIEDTLLDLANYTILLAMIRADGEGK